MWLRVSILVRGVHVGVFSGASELELVAAARPARSCNWSSWPTAMLQVERLVILASKSATSSSSPDSLVRINTMCRPKLRPSPSFLLCFFPAKVVGSSWSFACAARRLGMSCQSAPRCR